MHAREHKIFAFVIMPFSKGMKSIYDDAIKRPCESAGIRCERADEQVHNQVVMESIYNQIRIADIVVAELSKPNLNVYYELGYARALGKRIVLVANQSSSIGFDLRGYQRLNYTDRLDLANRLPALLKESHKSVNPFNDVIGAFAVSADAQPRIKEFIESASRDLHFVGANFHIILNDRQCALMNALRRGVNLTFVTSQLKSELIKTTAKIFDMAPEQLYSQCEHSLAALSDLRKQAHSEGLGRQLKVLASAEPPQYRGYGFDIDEPYGRLLLIPYVNYLRSSHSLTYELPVSSEVGRSYRSAMLKLVGEARATRR